jgi:hypothetical protein
MNNCFEVLFNCFLIKPVFLSDPGMAVRAQLAFEEKNMCLEEALTVATAGVADI